MLHAFDNDRDRHSMLYVLSLGILAIAGIGGHCVLVLVHRRVVSRDMILGNLPPTTYNGFGGERGEGREGIALMAVYPSSPSLYSLFPSSSVM